MSGLTKNALEREKLEELCKSRKEVGIYLRNGFKLKAVVKNFDDEVIVVNVMGKKQMVYKHMISSIEMEDSRRRS